MSSEIILYNTEDGKSKIELHVEDETVWLNIKELAELFQTTRQNIAKHIKNIFYDGELYENEVCNYKLHTTEHGAISTEKDYLAEIKSIEQIAKKGGRKDE